MNKEARLFVDVLLVLFLIPEVLMLVSMALEFWAAKHD